MVRLRSIGAGALVLAGCTFASATDIPEELQKGLDKAKTVYGAACKSAEKRLLAAFDAEEDLIRKQPGLKAEVRQQAIEAVGTERATFEKYGTIPFSPRMRVAALNYITTRRQAEKHLAAVYDRVIEHFQSPKVKDDMTAAAAVAEKKKILKPWVVGVWACVGVGQFRASWTWTLYSDGTGDPNTMTWRLDKDKLVLTNKIQNAPPGGFVDLCVINASGQTFSGKNQKVAYVAKLVEPAK